MLELVSLTRQHPALLSVRVFLKRISFSTPSCQCDNIGRECDADGCQLAAIHVEFGLHADRYHVPAGVDFQPHLHHRWEFGRRVMHILVCSFACKVSICVSKP